MSPTSRPILVYGAEWCPDARRARRFFDENRIEYKWLDVDKSSEANEFVRKINHGEIVLPTILFPDDSILVEPSNHDLANKLEGLRPTLDQSE